MRGQERTSDSSTFPHHFQIWFRTVRYWLILRTRNFNRHARCLLGLSNKEKQKSIAWPEGTWQLGAKNERETKMNRSCRCAGEGIFRKPQPIAQYRFVLLISRRPAGAVGGKGEIFHQCDAPASDENFSIEALLCHNQPGDRFLFSGSRTSVIVVVYYRTCCSMSSSSRISRRRLST